MSEIRVRDIDFDLDAARIADWNAGDVARTTLWNALSIMFPHGERFFIGSVAAYRNAVAGADLQAAVRGFTAQEALHTREHIAYNGAMQRYVDAATLDREVAERLDWIRATFHPLAHLAITCALEHFTAIMAREVLDDPAFLRGALPSYERLWTWHALEECEHKHVAFDVFEAATSGRKYWLRVRTMLLATVDFVGFSSKHVMAIMRGLGLERSPRAWAAFLWYTFGYPGLVRRILLPYLSYYAPGFHPSRIDDRSILARVRGRVEAWS